MIDRYNVCNSGSLYIDDYGEWVLYGEAQARIAELEAHNQQLIAGIFAGQAREQNLECRIAELESALADVLNSFDNRMIGMDKAKGRALAALNLPPED